MDANDYLKRVKGLEKKEYDLEELQKGLSTYRKVKKASASSLYSLPGVRNPHEEVVLQLYKKGKKGEDKPDSKEFISLDRINSSQGNYSFDERFKAGAIARRFMKRGIETGNLNRLFSGAEIYSKMGKGYVAIPRLVKGLEEMRKRGEQIPENYYRLAKDFIEQNSQKPPKTGNLEKSVGVVGSILGFGGAILFFSLKLTGNAISSMTTNSSNFLGFIFLTIGIIATALLMMKD